MATALVVVVVVVAPFVINKFVAICFLAARFLRTARETFVPPRFSKRIAEFPLLPFWIFYVRQHTLTHTHTAVSVCLCVFVCVQQIVKHL